MALTYQIPVPQTPETAAVKFGASSQSTQMDPATVAPSTLLTAGADGAVVTSLKAVAETTVVVEKIVVWVQLGGAGDWFVALSGVLPAYTQNTGDAQGEIVLIDKTNPDAALRLGPGDIVGITHHVDQQSMVFAEYTDY